MTIAFKVIFFSHTIRLLILCIFNPEIKVLNLVCFIGSKGISQSSMTITMKSLKVEFIKEKI